MGERLPVVSGREVRAVLESIGFEFTRQRGSHMMMRRTTEPYTRLVVPDHKEVAKGTLRGLIRDAGLTVEDFVELLH